MTNKILIVDDERVIRLYLQKNLASRGFDILTCETGEEAVDVYARETPDAVLLDLKLAGMSGIEVLKKIRLVDENAMIIIITAHGMVTTAVQAMKLGAYDFIEKPFGIEQITLILKNVLESSKLKREVQRIKREQKERYGFDNIIGTSKVMQDLFKMMEKLCQSDTSCVLFQGESGTGKDMFAKLLHYQSIRGDKPFIEINCTAIPEILMENELFGHERSAFTDAKAMKKGLFELADGGSIFLDEIGDMPISAQSKLLKVIDTQTFKRLGGTKDISVDVRIIAATNKDLARLVKDGKFREDLYYRLMVIPVSLCPLRERREDIIPLSKYFIDAFNRKLRGKIQRITPEAAELLINYPWPGNVRELKNVIERISILETGDTLLPEHLPIEMNGSPVSFNTPSSLNIPLSQDGVSLEKIEEGLIRQALNLAHGNQSKAAALLSMSRDTLRYRIKKFGIRT
ncbi:MAG: sigma-54-dependent Fis family transcriptional regulator [Deltaproteobacteria bacterium]|nr:sigma-54-dependent Fis family transcriptional regulator [Deltaproteobacteria bacterium]